MKKEKKVHWKNPIEIIIPESSNCQEKYGIGECNDLSDVSGVSISSGLIVKGTVNGKETKILVDSGSSVTLLADTLVQNIMKTDENPILLTASGEQVKIQGRADTHISINNVLIPITGFVAKGLTYDIILGNDMNQKLKTQIHLQENFVVFKVPDKRVVTKTYLHDPYHIYWLNQPEYKDSNPVRIEATLNDISTLICIDTGSCANIVSAAFVKPKNIKPVNNIGLKTANQGTLDIIGKTLIKLQVGTRTIFTTALVSKSTSNSLLTGNFFNKKYVQSIKFEEQQVQFVPTPTDRSIHSFRMRSVITGEREKHISSVDSDKKPAETKNSESANWRRTSERSIINARATAHTEHKPGENARENLQSEIEEEFRRLASIEDQGGNEEVLRLTIHKDTKIPPFSTKRVYCKILGNISENFGILQLTHGATQTKRLTSPDTAIDLYNKSKFRLQNTTGKPIKLFKGYHLGDVIPVEVTYEKVQSEDITISAVSPADTTTIDISKERLNELGLVKPDESLRKIISENQDVFAWRDSPFEAGKIKGPPEKIEVNDDTPIHIPPYRTGCQQRKIIKEYIDKMLAQKVIKPSSSPYSAPLLLIPKKEKGVYRPCIDFRKLNKIIKPEDFPMTRIDDVIHNLQGTAFYSTFDLESGYHQQKLDPTSSHLTAFSTHDGKYEFCVLPQGLSVSPLRFTRKMHQIFSPLLYNSLHIFLDDIVIFSKTYEEHLEKLKAFFKIVKQYNLKLKPSKSKIAVKEVKLLGFVVNKDGIRPDEDKVAAISQLKPPKTVKQVRSFLATVNFYRAHLPKLADVSAPLIRLTTKNYKFDWSAECQRAFDKIIHLLTHAPCLAHYDPENTELELHADASDVGMSAVLNQRYKDGSIRPVGYVARVLTEGEKNSSIVLRELGAIIYGLKKFHIFLFNVKFVIKSDNMALSYLHKMKDPSMKMAKLIYKLSEYQYEIQHLKGSKNVVPDYLSRFPATTTNTINEVTTRSQSAKQTPTKEVIQNQSPQSSVPDQPQSSTQTPTALIIPQSHTQLASHSTATPTPITAQKDWLNEADLRVKQRDVTTLK